MTLREVFDVLSPGCRIRTKTLNILRRQGLHKALDYLVPFLNNELRDVEWLRSYPNTTDWMYNVDFLRSSTEDR